MMTADREAEVLARLDHVTDPELDEPVTELGFVTGVSVNEAGVVSVEFRLPTYWCAANFAFMMADDMRREVSELPWVTGVEPRLGEHVYADKINHGVANGLSFQETFGDAADGDLRKVRETFLLKAFQRRQEALLRHLMETGHEAAGIVAMTVADLEKLTLSEAGGRLRRRYLERRAIAGPGDLAFVDPTGTPIAASGLNTHLQALRRVGINAEFNGAICSGLLAARFGEDPPSPDAEPTLLDFARMGPSRQQARQFARAGG
jgi:metal-sulfur cluster biosynthetic enzyme